MTLESTLARISAIEAALAPSPQTASGGVGTPAARGSPPASSPSSTTFSQLRTEAAPGSSTLVPGASPLGAPSAAAPLSAGEASPAALAAVAAARTQVGQAEMPPGSNESPRISEYRG